MDPVAAMPPLKTFIKHPGPSLCWVLPMIDTLSMPLLTRISKKIRDYGAVTWAFTAVVSATSMIPNLFSSHYLSAARLIIFLVLILGLTSWHMHGGI